MTREEWMLALALATPISIPCADGLAPEREAMELGGLLTLDGTNTFREWENTPAELSRVELSSIVHVQPGLEGSVTLMSATRPDSVVLYQAVGQWTLSRGKVVFGRQAFNMGLLTTRMVSPPMMFDLGEYREAGVTALATREALTLGFGLSSLASGPDSNRTHDPCVILNADFTPHGQLSRLSLQASRNRQAVDGAVNLVLGPILVDLEGLWRWKDDDHVAKGGYAVAIASPLGEHVLLAGRWDGLADEESRSNQQRFSGCITITPINHLFWAAEIAWDEKSGALFDIQLGLQSTLKLPGFQHKTLTAKSSTED